MVYLGLFVVLLGVAICHVLEHVSFWIYFAPSAWAILLFMAFGGTLVAYRPSEICSALSALLRDSTNISNSKEELLKFSKIFASLSKYSMSGAWVATVLGAIHVLGGVEEVIRNRGRLGALDTLAAGVALGIVGLLLGIFLHFIFDSMRQNLERKAN